MRGGRGRKVRGGRGRGEKGGGEERKDAYVSEREEEEKRKRKVRKWQFNVLVLESH